MKNKFKNTHELLSSKHWHVLHQEHQNSLSTEEIIDDIINYYESIIGCMPGNVYWFDQNCIAMGCNKNVLDMFGFVSISQFKGLTFEDMGKIANWSEEAIRSFRADTLLVLNTGQAKLNVEEPVIYHVSGQEMHFLTSRVPLFDREGKTIGVVGISIDITYRKMIERLLQEEKQKVEQVSEAKTLFLEEMRHDIRTPISGMIGIAELLKTARPEQLQEYSQWLITSGQELLNFLNSALESINLNTGDIPIISKQFSLYETLESVMNLHRAKAIEKNIDLSLSVDPKIPVHLLGDSVRIYRIMLEILSNALKFTPNGSVTVRATLVKKIDYDLVIQIEIQDTGIGISKDKQQDLLIRFNRASASYEGIYKGSGLGLNIAKRFIDDLSGKIYIDSELNKGTRFILLLPFKQTLLGIID